MAKDKTKTPISLSNLEEFKNQLATVAISGSYKDLLNTPATFTPSAHNQASSTINAMTGYTKPTSTSAIAASDTLNAAIGKIEKALDGKQPIGSYVTSSGTAAKATADANGNVIADTYVKSVSISGRTVTITKGNGSSETQTTQDTTYTSGAGLTLSGTQFINTGVRSLVAGSTADKLVVNTNGTSATITINNVANATKATVDSAGNTITTTYFKIAGGNISGATAFNNANTADSAMKIRRGTGTSEQVAHYVDDSIYHIDYTNDETANVVKFTLKNTDTENSDGSGANTSTVTIAGSSAGSVVTANTFVGTFSGTSTKALQDGNGAVIASTYLKLAGGTMTGTINTPENTKPAVNFRSGSSGYTATLNYDTSGNEALAINLKNAVTSFMINTGVDGATWTTSGKWTAVTPALQVKNNSVYINELIPNGTTPTYKLNVNGNTNIKGNCSITGQVTKANAQTSWVTGRNVAPFRTLANPNPTDSQYTPILSAKSYQGSWELGPYSSNILHLSYITDANYDAGTNAQTANYQFKTDGTLVAKTFSGALSGNATSATKATQDGNGATIASTYLKLAGGIMTGNLITTAKICGKSTYSDGSGTTYTGDLLSFNTANVSYGHNVALGGGGNTVVGAGESYSSQLSALAGDSGENCYICADANIYFKSYCDTFSNAKTMTYNTSGNLSVPGTVTAPTFSGSLNGNATSATKATQDSDGKQINTTYMKVANVLVAYSGNISGLSSKNNGWYSFSGTISDTTGTWIITKMGSLYTATNVEDPRIVLNSNDLSTWVSPYAYWHA